MNTRIRLSENFHVLLWLIKDSCWMLDFETLGNAEPIGNIFSEYGCAILDLRQQYLDDV